METVAIPLRLQENGLLQREGKNQSVLALLAIMARTPQGSWQGCPVFGLRDLFEDRGNRADLARAVAERINETFADLGMQDYVVTEVVRELSSTRETDTYTLRLEDKVTAELLTTAVSSEY